MAYRRFAALFLVPFLVGSGAAAESGDQNSRLARFVHSDSHAFQARLYGYEKDEFLTGQEVKPGIYRSETLAASQIAAITPAHTMIDILAEFDRQADLRVRIADQVHRHNLLARAIGKAARSVPETETAPREVAWDELVTGEGHKLAGEFVRLATGRILFRERLPRAGLRERVFPLEAVESLWLNDRAGDLARFRRQTERLQGQLQEDEAALDALIDQVREMIEHAKEMAAAPPPAIDSQPQVPTERRRLEVQQMNHRSGERFEELMRDISWYYGAATEIQNRRREAPTR